MQKVANDFLLRDQPLHILINNAGVAGRKRTRTADGIETTFAVNTFIMVKLKVSHRENIIINK